MVRHPDIHRGQCLYQTFSDKPVCLTGVTSPDGGVGVRQLPRLQHIIIDTFNTSKMDFRTVDGADESFTGNQPLILVIQIQHGILHSSPTMFQNQHSITRTGGGENTPSS